jgi:hypothetical protein
MIRNTWKDREGEATSPLRLDHPVKPYDDMWKIIITVIV